ncbi:MAG: endonuclease III [Planctomycetota bacterium]
MESLVDKKKRAQKIFNILAKTYPDCRCALNHKNAFELLIATILSAQCTDERVNIVTADLFKKYKNPADFASLPAAALEQEIKSTGFYRNKTKSILGACKRIREDFGGSVPQTMDELLTLPGVARKTANVVLGTAFGKATGVVVDTHVFRLAYRMALSDEMKYPEKMEQDLMAIFPKSQWIMVGHLLIWHGRRICTARQPMHDQCPVERLCPKRERMK